MRLMDDPIIALQETVAHQSIAIEQLHGELYAQQQEIAELQKQLKRLHDQLRAANDAAAAQPHTPEPPPPHY